MSLKEMCVHCLDLQQIPRREKKMSRQNATAKIFLNPGKRKLFHIWGSFKNFRVRSQIWTEKKE